MQVSLRGSRVNCEYKAPHSCLDCVVFYFYNFLAVDRLMGL